MQSLAVAVVAEGRAVAVVEVAIVLDEAAGAAGRRRGEGGRIRRE